MKNKKAKVLALSALLAFSGALVSCDDKGTSNDGNHQGQNVTSSSETTNSSSEAGNSEVSSQGGEVVSSEGGNEEVSSQGGEVVSEEGGSEEVSSEGGNEEISSSGTSEEVSSEGSSEEPIELEEGELARLKLNKNKATGEGLFEYGDENLSLSYESAKNNDSNDHDFAKIFKNNVVTISSNKSFNKITFICTKDNAAEGLSNVTTDVGTFIRDELTVTLILNESTTSVTFTVNQSKVQVEQISIWSFEKKAFEGLSLNNASAVYGDENLDLKINGLEAYPNADYKFEYFDEAGEKVEKPTNAGKYVVKAIVSDKSGEYEKLELTSELVINKAKVALPTKDETIFTYNGKEQKYEVKEADEYNVENYVQIAAGTYKVKVSLVDEENYEWEDPSFNGELEFVINKKEVSLPTLEEQNFVFDGTEHTLKVPESDLYFISGNKQTNAGEHEVKFELVDPDNYEFKDGKDTLTFKIDPKVVSYSMEDREYVQNQTIFEGLNHDLEEGMSVTYSYFDENGDFLGEGVKPTTPGKYVVKANIVNKNGNFKVENEEITAKILIKSFPDDGVSLDTVTAVYGDEYTVDLTGKEKISDDSAKVYTIKYFLDGVEVEKPTDANTYEIKAVFSEEAHAKGYNDLTSTLKITRKVVSLPTVDALTYNGSEQTLLVLDGSEAYKLADGEVNVATDAGTYKVKLVVVDEKNTKFADDVAPEVEVVINKAKVALPTVKENLVYNGSKQVLVEENELYTVAYNDAINAGKYEIEVELNNSKNYEWASEFDGKLEATIAKASWDSLTITNDSPTSIKVKEGEGFTADDVVITGIKDATISIIKVNGEDGNKVSPGEDEQSYVVSLSSDNYVGTKELDGKIIVTQKTKIAVSDLEDQVVYIGEGKEANYDLSKLEEKYGAGNVSVTYKNSKGETVAKPVNGDKYLVNFEVDTDNFYLEDENKEVYFVVSNMKKAESIEELDKAIASGEKFFLGNSTDKYSYIHDSAIKEDGTIKASTVNNYYSTPINEVGLTLENATEEGQYYISYVEGTTKYYINLGGSDYKFTISTENPVPYTVSFDEYGKVSLTSLINEKNYNVCFYSNGNKIIFESDAVKKETPKKIDLYYVVDSNETYKDRAKAVTNKSIETLKDYYDEEFKVTDDNYKVVNEKYNEVALVVDNYKKKYGDESLLEGYSNFVKVKEKLDTYLASAETYTITFEENADVSKVEIVGYESLEAFNASKPVKGTEYTIKVTCVEGKEVSSIKIGETEIKPNEDGLFTLTVTGDDKLVFVTGQAKIKPTTLSFTSNDYKLVTKSSNEVNSFTVDETEFGYVSTYFNSSYLMLSKSAGAIWNNTSKETIESITIKFSGSTSEKVLVGVSFSDSVISGKTVSSNKVTGKKGEEFTFTPADSSKASYFNISVLNSNNAQLVKIVITYAN